uniref:Uncharacterized protein n=1 Tax=Timema poppense TaxID=170557 RepID=A0A7R9HJC7_TIMPO|nr:unnamed protein product [Timema poppensis]
MPLHNYSLGSPSTLSKKLKELFLSRNNARQVHAAKILLENLKARPSLSESLLKEDVAESLAETMTKIHAPFLS